MWTPPKFKNLAIVWVSWNKKPPAIDFRTQRSCLARLCAMGKFTNCVDVYFLVEKGYGLLTIGFS